MMDSTDPTTEKECHSTATAPTMARVPLVGRLHLYLPQFPTKPFSYFHSSSDTSVDYSLTPPPTPPPEREEHQEIPEQLEVETHPDTPDKHEQLPVENIASASPVESVGCVEEETSDVEEDLTANRGPLLEKNSMEYVALIFSFLFLAIESFIRVITLALRKYILLSRCIHLSFARAPSSDGVERRVLGSCCGTSSLY